MLKILKILFIAIISFLLFSFIAKNNGTVEVNWLNYQIKTSIAVFIVTLAFTIYVTSHLFSLRKAFKKRRKYNKKRG
jgi:uncharacterized integral membrane protein